MREMLNKVESVLALSPQAITTDTTTNGEIIDMKGFESLLFIVASGTLTDGDYAFKIEHGADSGLSDAADVPAELLVDNSADYHPANDAGGDVSFADSDDDTVKEMAYIGEKRYVRLSLVSTSTSSGGTLGATAIKGHAREMPA